MGHARIEDPKDAPTSIVRSLLDAIDAMAQERERGPFYDPVNTPILLTQITGEGRVLVAVFVPDIQAARNTGGLGIYLSEQLVAQFDLNWIVGTDRDGDPVRVTFDIDYSLLRLTKPIRL